MSNKRYILIICYFLTVLTGCSMKSETTDYAYLNNYYTLTQVGYINGADPLELEVLSKYNGFESYSNLFNTTDSFINFQCKGDDIDHFYCEGSIKLLNKNGDVIVQNDSFICRAEVGLYSGLIVYYDLDDYKQIGDIYINTPHWCRIQLEYDVDNSGTTKLLTFEFFKGKFNELPDFMK